MRDLWFLFCMCGLAGLVICAVAGAVVDFFNWRAAVNREAWWRHVTGIDD